jgi:predicted GH43/DUF377 family glycosyl hydrolase
MIAALERFASNPLIRPSDISFTRASGTFNPGAGIDHASGRVVLLVRVYEEDAGRSYLGLALSSDGEHIDEIWKHPAIVPEASYEELGVEDPRITWLRDERRYAITYTGHSSDGPRVCLITTDNLLAPERYVRHGPRIAGENKNCVVFPEKIDGQYVILHRPMPNIVCVRVASLEDEWPLSGATLVGPQPNTWRSSRVGAGSPPIRTRIGWLFSFHGATSIEEGNVYSMGWCVLDLLCPEIVRYVSDAPALMPETPYEIEFGDVPQVDRANFITGIRVVFPEGMVELGEDVLVYYGAADVAVAGARVNRRDLVDSIESAIKANQGGVPL